MTDVSCDMVHETSPHHLLVSALQHVDSTPIGSRMGNGDRDGAAEHVAAAATEAMTT